MTELGVNSSGGQETLQSRLAQWFASLRVGGGVPRAVESRPESIGSINRGADNGAAVQGGVSREEVREQSARLIERPKAEGFYWPDDSPILFELRPLPHWPGSKLPRQRLVRDSAGKFGGFRPEPWQQE